MSPNKGKGRRPTTGKGGSGSGGRPTGPAAARRLGLLVFGVTFVVLFAVVAIAEGVGDPSVPSDAVAVIEDAPEGLGTITEEEFQRSFDQAAAQTGAKAPKPGDPQYDELRETALSGLFDMIWIQGEAAEKGVEVSDKEIADELAKLKKENFKTPAEYQKFLKESGYSQADVNTRVKLQIIGTEIQTQITEGAPKPSQDEIENYYEAAKATQFTQPATRDIRTLVNKDQAKAEKAKAALDRDSSDASWKKVAKAFSEDELTKAKGGVQKGIAEGTLEEPLSAAIFEASEDQVEGPVKTAQGYTVFMVEGSTPETVSQLSEVEAQIKSQLEQQAQQDTFGKFVADYTSRWQSRTFCADDFLIERCANFTPSGHPATAPPACFEADPKEAPEACPAPVFQLIPAVPGSITPVEPRGKPLPQRPRPAGDEATAETPEIPGSVVPTP